MTHLSQQLEHQLCAVAHRLVDQSRARIAIPPKHPSSGHWFGGGNLVEDSHGNLVLVGRFRNPGDSRLGLSAGERGFELAVFRSMDHGKSFTRLLSFSKSDLEQPGRRILSIEGSALYFGPHGVELFVSSEKDGIGYPPGFESFLKSDCGVWTIDRLAAKSVEELKSATPETVFASTDLEHLHLKDPHVYAGPRGELMLMFCTHPYSWSSSNTAFAIRVSGSASFGPPQYWFARGTTWDVAISRGTSLVDIPSVGKFRDIRATLLFYDGGESLRNLEQHARGVVRPRGYSCEELGGIAYFLNQDPSRIYRLSRALPAFISPHGTGCSRYVDVLSSRQRYYVTWQQSQPDLSQPLVLNVVERSEVEGLLG